MKTSQFKDYSELPLFLNAAIVARVLGVSSRSGYELMHEPAFPELKHVILVDEDVDIFDTDDVLWAMNTRFQGDRDVITIPGVRCHPLDPSSSPEYTGSIRDVASPPRPSSTARCPLT